MRFTKPHEPEPEAPPRAPERVRVEARFGHWDEWNRPRVITVPRDRAAVLCLAGAAWCDEDFSEAEIEAALEGALTYLNRERHRLKPDEFERRFAEPLAAILERMDTPPAKGRNERKNR